MKTFFAACLMLGTCLAGTAWSAETVTSARSPAAVKDANKSVKIRITMGTQTMTAVLDDNATARDFVALLPLTVKLRDYSPAEKVSDALPRRLDETGALSSAAGKPGEIAYYAPWGNIAFYRGMGPDAPGVIKIGNIISGSEALQQPGQLNATLSREVK